MAGRIGGVINYKIVGDGINVVLLHGWGGNASAFLFVAERLKSFTASAVKHNILFVRNAEKSKTQDSSDMIERMW